MEPEGSLPHSLVPATCPSPEPARSVHTPTSCFLKIHLNIILPSMPGLSSGLFPSGFPTKTLNTPLLSPIYHSHCFSIHRFIKLCLGNQSKLDTCSYELLFSPKNNTATSQNIRLSSWIILYVIYKPYVNTEQHLQGLIKKFRDLVSENYNLLLMAKNIK